MVVNIKNSLISLPFLFFSCIGLSQTIGTIKTEEYRADFEKKQYLDFVSDYNGDIVIPIQILKIGINDEVYEMYPELKDKRVGLGVANIVLEYLESTDRFKFTEDKAEIKNKMIAQDKASDKGISSNKIEFKGNIILANYFVYIEVYDFSVSEDEIIKGGGSAKITQTTRLGLQIRFVDAQSGEVITGSGLGESNTIKTSSLLDDVDEIKFNQSTIGISTKKSLETASSRVVSKLIKKGVFKE
jgi:hypothetical protein